MLDALIPVTLVPLYRQKRLGLRDRGLRPAAPRQGHRIGGTRRRAGCAHQRARVPGCSRQADPVARVQLACVDDDKVVVGVQVCVSAPVFEEVFFRGPEEPDAFRERKTSVTQPITRGMQGEAATSRRHAGETSSEGAARGKARSGEKGFRWCCSQ